MKHTRLIRTVSLLTALLLLCVCLPLSALAEGSEPDDNALITYGYLKKALADLRRELLEEFASGGALAGAEFSYTDKTFPRGTVLLLQSGAEAIFRGGEAIVVTVSPDAGKGISDLSTGTECFSGCALTFGHIYYQTNPESRAYLLVIGEKAAFTMKGSYEIR